MAYRGAGLLYKIRKTTKNNKTGDNYSITVPRIIAQKFFNTFFKIEVSGNSISFISGCHPSFDEGVTNISFKTQSKVEFR